MTPVKVPYVDFPAQFEASRDETLGAVERVFARGDFILGEEVETLEREFARLCGTKFAAAVANGTDALLLALRALGVGPGDEVVTVSNSWISSAASVALLGARPVFVDVGDDFCMDPSLVERAIGPKTKAILPVDLTGRLADLRAIAAIASRKGIPVVEDAAQAVGANRDGVRAGAGGAAGCFSLHPLKSLNAAGDAGMITTNDAAIDRKLRLLRNHGLVDRDHSEIWGFNSRLDTLQAAVVLTRLPRLGSVIARKQGIAARYAAGFGDRVRCPVARPGESHTFHTFVIDTDRRDGLQEFLASRGVGTKIHYPIPIHLQEAARGLGYGPGSLPATERYAGRILSLPIHPYLTDAQVDRVIESVRDFFRS